MSRLANGPSVGVPSNAFVREAGWRAGAFGNSVFAVETMRGVWSGMVSEAVVAGAAVAAP